MRYEENRLDEAEALCTEVLPLLCVQSTVENVATAYVTLSRVKASNGRHTEAFQLLDYLHSMLESGSHARFLAQVCAEKIRLLLSQDNLQRARAVAWSSDCSDERARASGAGRVLTMRPGNASAPATRLCSSSSASTMRLARFCWCCGIARTKWALSIAKRRSKPRWPAVIGTPAISNPPSIA